MFGTPQHVEINKKQKCESSSQFRQHVFGTPQHDEFFCLFENIPLTVDAREEINIYVEGPPEEVENHLDEHRICSNESVLNS